MQNKIKVAIVGNPNCGKSTIFNALTGLNQRVGNFPGITVEKKTGFFKISEKNTAELIDLPGAYSLYPKAKDDLVTFQILNDVNNKSHPDVIVFVADASNLKRSLLFYSQVLDLNIPSILILNMRDIAIASGLSTNVRSLSEKLGVKVIPVNSKNKKGINKIKKEINHIVEDVDKLTPTSKKLFINIRKIAPEVIEEIKNTFNVHNDYTAFQMAVNAQYMLNEQKKVLLLILKKNAFNVAKAQGLEIIDRYKKIDKITAKSIYHKKGIKRQNTTNKIDKILTHKIFGYLIFLLINFLIFQGIFSIAEYPMKFIEQSFILVRGWLHNIMPAGIITDLLTDGVLAGLGGVLVFIPQIIILFAFISIMEETGYMARISFIMDKLMTKIGLSGRSVVPLMSGMACAVPAIMAARNIESWKDRIITIMITPLMSCSARLPVYALLIAMIVPDTLFLGFINLKGLTLMGMYMLGLVTAVLIAWIMKLLIRAKDQQFFIMEMPRYRLPQLWKVLTTTLEKVKVFVFEAGKVIITISIVLWFLASFGPQDIINKNIPVANESSMQQNKEMLQSDKLLNSFAGHLGKIIEPVIKPLGFDWKIGIAIITSFAAREIFVGTMATLYSIGGQNDNRTIKERMAMEYDPHTGKQVYGFATALSLMVFFAFAMQCISTIAIVRRETKGWKWPLIQFVYLTGLAYMGSLLTYQILK